VLFDDLDLDGTHVGNCEREVDGAWLSTVFDVDDRWVFDDDPRADAE